MMTEAMMVVHMKVSTVLPISLPARLALFIFAMDEEMEKKTIGTTTQNIILMNSVPSGSSTPAPGQAKPTMMPATMPMIILKKNQLLFRYLANLDMMRPSQFVFASFPVYANQLQSKLRQLLESLQKVR